MFSLLSALEDEFSIVTELFGELMGELMVWIVRCRDVYWTHEDKVRCGLCTILLCLRYETLKIFQN